MKKYTLSPSLRFSQPQNLPLFGISEMEAEPMLFSADQEFALKNGGPITNWALEEVGEQLSSRLLAAKNAGKDYSVVIDTRTHMLMPDFFPAIPGWHCDAVPRSSYYDQPDLGAVDLEYVTHFVVVLASKESDPNCYTEFISNPLEFEIDESERVWTQVHKQTQQALSEGRAERVSVQNGLICEFDQHAIHRAVRAESRGWRWFFRASVYHSKPMNKIRHQTQVYIAEESGGW
jgi:hypothetical protein